MSRKRESKRRTQFKTGYVNFPVDDPEFPSDGQGGMFVRLVVYDRRADENYFDRWMVCCGGSQSIVYDESYVRDDLSLKEHKMSKEGGDAETNELFHFPWLGTDQPHEIISRAYLCIMTIGSTGWSNTNWTCTFDELTEKGKELYRQLQELYDGCEIILQTWLDT